ncbi:MAG: hypothetical protein EBS49_04380 [Verrucomicrobia bacterium]|nr:hypothetical protein [Verrucomicrobiota bacterium]
MISRFTFALRLTKTFLRPACHLLLSAKPAFHFACLLSAISYLLASGLACAWDHDLPEQNGENNEHLYELKRARERRLADFVGGVYGTGGVVIDDTTAHTDEGLVIADGNQGFITRRGYYTRNGDVYAGGGGIVVKDDDLFYGSGDGVTFRSGQVYFGGSGGSSIVVSSGNGVSKTMRKP